MPTFEDTEEKKFVLLEPGDYRFTVNKFEIGISTGAKTAGAEKYQIEFDVEGARVIDFLLDHPSTQWKLDAFLRCTDALRLFKIEKGQPFEFRRDKAEQKVVPWVNPIGLRGWCRIVREEFEGRNGDKLEGNRIGVFYGDKEKLAPVNVAPEPDPFASDQPDDGEPF